MYLLQVSKFPIVQHSVQLCFITYVAVHVRFLCPKGYHGSTIENDETSCQVCPAGTFSVEGASKCCGCDQGTYVKTIDSDHLDEISESCPSCNKCPLGSYTGYSTSSTEH